MKKLLSLFLLFCSLFAFGQNYPDKPNPPKLVNDYTGTLAAGEIASLEQRLVAFDNQTTNQISVVIVATTGGVEVSEYATELGRKWGIGNKVNNGVLLLIAKDDHKLSIVNGYGLEGKMTDATSQSIIDNDIVPAFKTNNYYQGISNGIESIMQATQGAYKADKNYANRGNKSGSSGGVLTFLIIVVVIIVLLSRRGGGGGMMSRRGYGGFSNPIWWLPIGGGGGGGGGSSSGGGGFGGFGGGSFGGGGASGSW